MGVVQSTNRGETMKGTGFFKAGAVILILTACVHMIGFFQEPASENEAEKTLIDLMKNYQMELPGAQRTMMNIMDFFSLSYAMFTAFVGIFNLWILRQGLNASLIKKIIRWNAVYWTIYLIPLYVYTFLFPQAFTTLAWLCFMAALIISRKAE